MKKLLSIMMVLVLLSGLNTPMAVFAVGDDLSQYQITWLEKHYDKVDPFINGYARTYLSEDGSPVDIVTYLEGCYCFEPYKMGLIDSNGNEVVEAIYDYVTCPDKNGHFEVAIGYDGAGDGGGVWFSYGDEAQYSKYNTLVGQVNDFELISLRENGAFERFNKGIRDEYLNIWDNGTEITKNDIIYMLEIHDEATSYDYDDKFTTFDNLEDKKIRYNDKNEVLEPVFQCTNTNGDVVISEIESYISIDFMPESTAYLPFTGLPSVFKNLGNGNYEAYSDKAYASDSSGTYELIYSWNEGLTSVESNGKYGVLDRNANIIVPYVLDYPAFFNDGIATICYNGKFGIMKDPRQTGGQVVKPINLNIDMANELHDLGLFNGKSTTEFVPALEDATTAAEAITLIGRALKWDVNIDAVSSFTDVPNWAVPYTEYAKNHNITTGVGDGLFGVDQIDGKRMFTWFLAALGEDKADVWANTEKYAEKYEIDIPTSALRNDVVYVIYEGIKHPMVDDATPLIEKLKF